MSVAIVTLPGDVHAHAVRWPIRKLGGDAVILHPADLCDRAQWTLDPAKPGFTLEYRGRNEVVSFKNLRSVWMRRVSSGGSTPRMPGEPLSAVMLRQTCPSPIRQLLVIQQMAKH